MKIAIRACDDWIAVYKDGRSVWQTHSCSLKDGLEALGVAFEYQYYEGDPCEKDFTPYFPEELSMPASKDTEPDDDYHLWWHADGTTR